MLWITLLSGELGQNRPVTGLFWELKNRYWRDIILNILLFVPLGFISGKLRTISIGFVFSVLIELLQYLLGLGQCEADDVLHNTIGIIIGVVIWRKLKRRYKKCIKNT